MLKNFFKVAVRNLWRHKGFSFINIAGLTLGLTACLLIGLFVWDELQFDRNVPGGKEVYRLYNERNDNTGTSYITWVQPMYATTLKQQFPEVEATVRLMNLQSKTLFETADRKIYEEGGLAGEQGFFDVFPLGLKYGNPAKALIDPNSIVLTSETARKYFGNENPVGREMKLDKVSYLVSGVLPDNLSHFHLKLNYIIPITGIGLPPERLQSWGWQQLNTYIRVKPGTDVARLESKFQGVAAPETKREFQDGATIRPHLQPLEKVHLYSANFKFNWIKQGNITYVNALTTIAVFILLIACFNFVNLSTARSLQRAREVGVRKSIGASRRQLLLQFTGETVFLTVLSILISIGVALVFRNALNEFTGKSIPAGIFLRPGFLVTVFVLTLAVGSLAGIYPALVLSGFEPVKVLKGGTPGDRKPGQVPWLRHSLVVVQFTLSALLIISAIVVFRQVNYLHNKELGFNKDQIMFFPMRGDNMFAKYETFKNRLLETPGISSVSIGYGFPGDATAGDGIIVPRNGQDKEQGVTQLMVDFDYIKTLGLQVIAGREFSAQMPTDATESFMINETAVKELGFGTPEKALGQRLAWKVWVTQHPDSLKQGRIIGVVKDFHFKSLYDKVDPAVLQIYPPAYWKVAVKMKTAQAGAALAHVKKVWNEFTPDYPIEYRFLDENFEEMYQSEDKLKTLLALFTGIAIFVGCLGLFGLAAYAAQRRMKEIGIRKVLGASVQGLVLLLSRDFIRLVLIALIIAGPIAWWLMNQWLEDFAYRIEISWWIFVMAAVVAILIALLTVSFQAIRAALANPVKNLRTE